LDWHETPHSFDLDEAAASDRCGCAVFWRKLGLAGCGYNVSGAVPGTYAITIIVTDSANQMARSAVLKYDGDRDPMKSGSQSLRFCGKGCLFYEAYDSVLTPSIESN
jgi:hypothetical protein